jgi:antitoxin component of MazEF toxin-antitoxin module
MSEENEIEMVTAANVPAVEVPAPVAPVEERVRVRIKATADTYQIISTHTLPSRQAVVNCLDPVHKRGLGRVRTYASVVDLIYQSRDTIPLSHWSAAIAQATLKMLAIKGQQDVTTEQGSLAQGAYMSLGGMLYQLNPVAAIKGNAAMAPLKKRVLDAAQRDAEIIKQAAQQTANGMIQQAQEMQRQAKIKLAEANSGCPPPKQFAEFGFPLKKFNVPVHKWGVGLWLQVSFTSFAWKPEHATEKVVWTVPDEQLELAKPVPVLVWVLVDGDGKYAVTSIRRDGNSPALPHMTTDQTCGSVGDAPERLNWENSGTLIRGLQRCFQQVNLSSMYESCERWREAFKAFIPPELQEVLNLNYQSSLGRIAELAAAKLAAERAEMARNADELARHQAEMEAEQSGRDVWSIPAPAGGR